MQAERRSPRPTTRARPGRPPAGTPAVKKCPTRRQENAGAPVIALRAASTSRDSRATSDRVGRAAAHHRQVRGGPLVERDQLVGLGGRHPPPPGQLIQPPPLARRARRRTRPGPRRQRRRRRHPRGAPRERHCRTLLPMSIATAPESPGDRLVSGEAVELDVRVARLGSRALALHHRRRSCRSCCSSSCSMLATMFASGDRRRRRSSTTALGQAVFTIILVDHRARAIRPAVETAPARAHPRQGRDGPARGPRRRRPGALPARVHPRPGRHGAGVARPALPVVTWVASLSTMLVGRSGKRLGDRAAGTIVIHERTPASWGWVPAMPPPLAQLGRRLDLTGLDDEPGARRPALPGPQPRDHRAGPHRARPGPGPRGRDVHDPAAAAGRPGLGVPRGRPRRTATAGRPSSWSRPGRRPRACGRGCPRRPARSSSARSSSCRPRHDPRQPPAPRRALTRKLPGLLAARMPTHGSVPAAAGRPAAPACSRRTGAGPEARLDQLDGLGEVAGRCGGPGRGR